MIGSATLETGTRPYVEFRDVDFRFGASGPLVLRGLDLAIRRREFFTLLGPSGCGKTTVLNILAGFERPTAGEVPVDGEPIRGPGRDRVVIFQDSDSLYTWLTALENVEFPLRVAGIPKSERRERALDALKLVGLQGHERKYPAQLSGGMKQRTQLARALVLESPILLMDEPFGALDAQTREILQDELVEISQRTQRTILFITHDIGEAILLADRIGIMRAGPESAIKEIIAVTLPRPRDRGSAEFGALYHRIHQVLAEEVRRALREEDSRL